MHPDVAALVSLVFGELPEDRARRLTHHAAGCAACRRELDRLRGSLDDMAPADRVAAADSDTLLDKLRSWEVSGARSGLHGEALKRCIAAELAPYVGETGADTLLGPVQDDGRDLLTRVAPLLTLFLGRRAAGNIVSRVVEKTIVGTRTLCEP